VPNIIDINDNETPQAIAGKMTSRPTVTIATAEGKSSGETHPLPAVFKSPIRPDIVQYGNPVIE